MIEIREGLTGPWQVVEGSRFRGDPNLRIQAQLLFDALNVAGGVG